MSNFYIEAVEATTITITKYNSLTAIGTANYAINDGDYNSYTYGSQISLLAGDKCY